MIIEITSAVVGMFGVIGGIRVKNAKKRFNSAADEYRSIISRTEQVKHDLRKVLRAIGAHMMQAIKDMKAANQILRPLKRQVFVPKIRNSGEFENKAILILGQSTLVVSSYNDLVMAGGVGLGVGSAIAVGSWAAMSALGTASTGTAIASLHGVAATNAILASLGHGALAAGGTGMLGGKFALGGIVLLPIAAFMGIVAHGKAEEINKRAVEIEDANKENEMALLEIKTEAPKIEGILPKVEREAAALREAVFDAYSVLLPYGIFSRVCKFIRFHIKGYYYTAGEMAYVENVASAIDKFLGTIGANTRDDCNPPKVMEVLS